MTTENRTLPPLLVRTSFREDESLPSLLERLRVLNLYVARTTIYDVCRAALPRRVSDDTLDVPVRPETYTVLSDLTMLPARKLYDATVHRYEPCLRSPDNAAHSIRLPSGEQVNVMPRGAHRHHLRPDSRAAFCRACLAEDAYQRTVWIPQATTVCLRHGCLLEERCRHCDALQDTAAVVGNSCTKCARPLSDGPVTSMEDDRYSLETARVIASCLGRSEADASEYGIPDCPPNVAYRLLDGVRQCLLARLHSIDETYWCIPTGWTHVFGSPKDASNIAQSHVLYMTAMKAIRDWPNGFHKFLSVYDGRKSGADARTLHAGFGGLYTVWMGRNWQSPSFDFVREAFDAYLTSGRVFVPSAVKSKRHRRALLKDWEYLTVSDAMQKLGIGQDTFEMLLTSGTLHEAFPRDSRPFRYRLVARREIEELKAAWSAGLTLTEAAAMLGLSDVMVADLAQHGRLDVLRQPQMGSAGWLIRKSSVERYRDAILSRVQVLPDADSADEKWIDLRDASRILGPVGSTALTILERVASGNLPAYRFRSASQTLESLLFIEADVTDSIEAIKAENGWYDVRDIASLLHLKRTVIYKWIEHGLLAPATRSGLAVYFDRTAVQQFIDEHVFTEQAAEILKIGILVVQKWARGGRLKPVSGPDIDGCHRWLFVRAEVERLRPENRLTAPQMAKKLGISRSQLVEWIKSGKVVPVSGPGIDGMGQYLFLQHR